MQTLRENWITGVAIGLGALVVVLAVGLGASDSLTSTESVLAALAMGLPGLALFGGLWNMHSGRFPIAASYIGIALGLVAAAMWFWMVIPPIAALVVLWFGVIRQGLARELAVARLVSG